MSNYLLIPFFSAMLLLSEHSSSANIQAVDVTTTGRSDSYQQAINEALIDAIAQVHGKTIESEKLLLSLELSVATDTDAAYFASDTYLNLVKEKTKGAVLGYQVVESNQVENLWVVVVTTQVAQYKKSRSADRKRVVVLPFHANEDGYAINGNSLDQGKVVAALNHATVNELVQTRKFAVLDRTYQAESQQELAVAASGATPVAETARLGQTLVADYVLVGDLQHLSYSTQTRKMRTSDKTYQLGTGRIVVSYRLIETATSQIAFADKIEITMAHDDIPRAKRADTSGVADVFVTRASHQLTNTVINQVYPLAIISKHGDTVILSQGGSAVSVGEQYQVYQRGKKIFDPYTSEFVGYEEFTCCTLVIERVAPKQSYAKVKEGLAAIPDKVPARAFILREKIVLSKPAKTHSAKKISDKSSDDW